MHNIFSARGSYDTFVSPKRRSQNANGPVELQDFCQLNPDEKLNVMYGMYMIKKFEVSIMNNFFFFFIPATQREMFKTFWNFQLNLKGGLQNDRRSSSQRDVDTYVQSSKLFPIETIEKFNKFNKELADNKNLYSKVVIKVK